MVPLLDTAKTTINLLRHRGRTGRRLEIGPGRNAVPGFETLNICNGRWVDYIGDAAGKLPFEDDTFEVIYASHVLEHVPWHQTQATLREWVRVMRSGGRLEVWVPDGLKICQAFVAAEQGDRSAMDQDQWDRFNPERDPCLWASGRVFTYGDGNGNPASPNWHRAMFSPRFLMELMRRVGLTGVRQMDRAEVRGADHGWINLGVCGVKP